MKDRVAPEGPWIRRFSLYVAFVDPGDIQTAL
jgi:hypothetical protein